jgi:hypothetical protein
VGTLDVAQVLRALPYAADSMDHLLVERRDVTMRAQSFLYHRHLREYGLPLLLLTLPTIGIFWLDELGALILVAVAFAIGLVLRPAHIWIVWLGTIVLWWLAGGAYSVFGNPPPVDPALEETPLSFMVETIPFTALLVLLPMFLGRIIGRMQPEYRSEVH